MSVPCRRLRQPAFCRADFQTCTWGQSNQTGLGPRTVIPVSVKKNTPRERRTQRQISFRNTKSGAGEQFLQQDCRAKADTREWFAHRHGYQSWGVRLIPRDAEEISLKQASVPELGQRAAHEPWGHLGAILGSSWGHRAPRPKDELMTVSDSKWVYKNKDMGMMSTVGSRREPLV